MEVGRSTLRLLIVVVTALLLAIVVGLVALWPRNTTTITDPAGPKDLFGAKVTSVTRVACEDAGAGSSGTCTIAKIRLQEGPDRGTTVELPEQAGIDGSALSRGARIVVGYYPDAEKDFRYAYADRERRMPLLALALVFAVAVVALGRWRGARTLAGVTASFVVLAVFILPALLNGRDPVLVAIVGGGAITVIALCLARGINVGSTIALIGALASMALVGLLAWAFVHLSSLTGQADVDTTFLQLSSAHVQLQGLILAGIVIGTLGVLVDITMSQVSAVWDLHHANPVLSRPELYRGAIRIGRDRIASSVNILALAYAGASLPLFLLLTQAHQGLSDAANSEVVAVEIVRTLVGSIGLVASVPITTLLATWVIGEHQRGSATSDPRRYASRSERRMWEHATAAPVAGPSGPPSGKPGGKPTPPPDRAIYCPVEPKPVLPRGDGPSSSTSTRWACSTRWITSWAMRSPRCTW